jgi:DNA excision repair protein ERCC-2
VNSYTIAVRELCAFTAKTGDLDLRFTPSPSADEGMAGHKVVAARRGPTFRSEVSVRATFEELIVRGRADGFDASEGIVEEVKTFRGDLALLPENQRALHWAQAKMYAAMLLPDSGRPGGLTVRLVYLDVDSGAETILTQSCSAAELAGLFDHHCRSFIEWARTELTHRDARDRSLERLAFPREGFRVGQRELAAQAYLAPQRRGVLLAQAGTGIGKTLATLFATLKVAPSARIDKIFFLTAKTSGQEPPLEALRELSGGESPARLRYVELTARSHACEHPDKACHGDSCPLARGFFDRLPAARQAAVQRGSLTLGEIRQVARQHTVCPYFLAQELVRWADVVVADYNYMFDTTAVLHALTVGNGWRVSLLIDEAHNLVDRARAMYTATLKREHLRDAARAAPASLQKPLRRLGRVWSSLTTAQAQRYGVLAGVPERLERAVADACAALSDEATRDPRAMDPALLEFYFELLGFRRRLEAYGPHSIIDLTVRGRGHSELTVRNVLPAEYLRPRFAAATSAVLFSATLQPQQFYADMLGLPKDTAWFDAQSPFAPEQLDVRIVSHLPMRFASRSRSARPIAELMASQYRRQPGNYLAFFSSFDHLEMVAQAFVENEADIPTWCQQRAMNAPQRQAFLARFSPGGAGVAFAVLGGSFSEGIDLPGTRLIGAFVATLGLPQINPVNDEFRRTLDAALGTGFEYTYLYPGLRKVVQAAGRVIRTPTDKGTLYLIDERFASAAVQALLPSWWSLRSPLA